jgi:predicted sulfurtransferase
MKGLLDMGKSKQNKRKAAEEVTPDAEHEVDGPDRASDNGVAFAMQLLKPFVLGSCAKGAVKKKVLKKGARQHFRDHLSEHQRSSMSSKECVKAALKELLNEGKIDIKGDGKMVVLSTDSAADTAKTSDNIKNSIPEPDAKRRRSASTESAGSAESADSEASSSSAKCRKEAILGDERGVIDHANAMLSKANISTSMSPSVQPPKRTGNVTILLFYAYCDPSMTKGQQDNAIAQCYKVLNENDVSGRLRVGREGFNSTLTGPAEGVRKFTSFLKQFDPATFGETDFKYVDGQPDNQKLKGLKVWPVTEIVTYGFDPKQAPLDMRGTHLKPSEFHEALASDNSVVIDVRNFNESLIGRFNPPLPPGTENIREKVLDPCMRRSTEFPKWVQDNKHKLEGKQVLMYCTAGVRCERASAFMRNSGVENVYQLEGGIHRYLEAYPDDGGFWVGKNYVFDKRFSHGAEKTETISHCVYCLQPWDRYSHAMFSMR